MKIKNIYTLIIAALIFSINANSQTSLVWARDIGRTSTNSDLNKVYGFEKDTSGLKYVIAGAFYNTLDFDPGAGVNNLVGFPSYYSGYFAKYDVNGNYIWAKAITGTNDVSVNSITIDNLNNIYVSGYFRGTADFDPSALVTSLTATTGIDAYFAKYDENGNLLFVKQLRGVQAGFNDPPLMEIKTDNFYNIYLTGVYDGATNDFDPGAGTAALASVSNTQDVFYAKYSSSGNYVYAKSFGGTNNSDEAGSISIELATGKVLVGGHVYTGSGNNFAYRMLDAAGNTLFTQQIGTSTVQHYTNVVEFDQLGNFYISGAMGSAAVGSIMVDFDPGAGVLNLAAPQYACGFIAKYTTSNTLVWAQAYAPTSQQFRGLYITFDNYGNLLSLGNDRSTSNFAGFTWKQHNSSNGNVLTTSFIGGSSDNYCYGNIFQDKNNNLLISGQIGNSIFPYTIDADPTAAVYNLSTFGGNDIFFAKYASCIAAPVQPGTISGLSSVCANAGTTYSVAPVPGALSYSWTLPVGWTGTSSTNTISITTGTGSGTISITAFNTCGTSSASALSVTVNPAPVANASTAQTITCASPTVTLNGSGVTTYTWTGPGIISGSNSATPTVNTAGIYSLVGTASGCVSNTATVSLTSNTTPPSLSITASSNSLCSSGSVTLIASGASTYSWSTGSTNTTIVVSPTTSTFYNLTGTNSVNGCSDNTNIPITVSPSPTVSISGSTSLCIGNNLILTANGANTYTWNTTSTTNSISVSPTVNTVYSVNGTDANGCMNSANINVTVNPTPTVSVNSGSICSGSSFTITPSGASTYTIQGGSSVVSPGSNATYTVSGTSSAGCVAANAATSSVTVVSTPTANAGISQTITCASSSVTLNGSGVSTYTWNGPGIVSGGNTSSPVVNTAGTYSLVGSTSGCNSNTATVNVLTNTIAPTVTAASNSSLICGPPFQGTATLTASGSAATYSWMPSGSGASISVSPSVTTTYTVIATGSNGCTNMAAITQSVSTCTGVQQFGVGIPIAIGTEFVVYPNPTSGIVTVKAEAGLQVAVYNSIGELILVSQLRTANYELDLSAQANGIYFIRVGSVTKKIIRN